MDPWLILAIVLIVIIVVLAVRLGVANAVHSERDELNMRLAALNATRTAESKAAADKLALLQDEEAKRQDAFDALSAEELKVRRERDDLNIRLAALAANRAAEEKAAADKLALLQDAEAKLKDAFAALSAEALKASADQFLQLAEQNFGKLQEAAKGDLEKRQQAIAELLKPLCESLTKVDSQVTEMEKTRAGAYAKLEEQVNALSLLGASLQQETGNLVKALRAPQGRGQWGEMTLHRVVELAGMVDRCDFDEQVSTDTDEGRQRPDMIIRLPGGKNIVVDSKAPLDAYLEAIEAKDEASRQTQLQRHAAQVKTHIQALGRKSYWQQFQPAPEFVVLFLPSEGVFYSALQQDPTLIEMAAGEHVVIATPTTLISLLRAVAYGWSQEALAADAAKIRQVGVDLYERLSTLGEHMARLGRNLGNAVGAYNDAVGNLETRVLVAARRFKELKVVENNADIAELQPVDHVTRALQAPELTEPTPPALPEQSNDV